MCQIRNKAITGFEASFFCLEIRVVLESLFLNFLTIAFHGCKNFFWFTRLRVVMGDRATRMRYKGEVR